MGKKSAGEQLPEIPTNSAPAGKRRKKPGCLATIGIILIVLIVIAGVGTTINNHNKQVEYENQTFTWPTSGLATLLPEPATNKGQIISNTDTSLSVEVRGCDEASYSAYLKQCQDAGFTVEASTNSSSYDAYDEEGNKLRLSLYKSTGEINIMLDKAEEFDSLVWPTTGLAANLPVPASTMGKIITDSSSAWKATMGQTDKAAYKAYVEEVFAAGFDQNYDKGDESFTADNTGGLHVEVRYTGANTMSVGIKVAESEEQPDKDVSAASTAAGTTSSTQDASSTAVAPGTTTDARDTDSAARTADTTDAKTAGDDSTKTRSNTSDKKDGNLGQSLINAGGELLNGAVNAAADALVTPEFKEMLDSYETFMNHYVEIAKRAETSTDAQLLSEYGTLIQEEADWIAKIDAIDPNTLSAADSAYYVAVTGRVLAKVSELPQR